MGHEANLIITDFTSADNAGFSISKEHTCVTTATKIRWRNIFLYMDSACFLCNSHHKPFCKREEHKCRICGKIGHGARRCRLRYTVSPLNAEVSMEELIASYYNVTRNIPEGDLLFPDDMEEEFPAPLPRASEDFGTFDADVPGDDASIDDTVDANTDGNWATPATTDGDWATPATTSEQTSKNTSAADKWEPAATTGNAPATLW